MGEENLQSSVEEPPEPPIRGSRNYDIIPALPAPQTPAEVSVRTSGVSNKENLSLREALSLPLQIDTLSTNPDITTNICYENWSELYKTAHTFTDSQVAQALGVDPRYIPTQLVFYFPPANFAKEMGSVMLKRSLAFSKMDLTRLKELKGYPCGEFC